MGKQCHKRPTQTRQSVEIKGVSRVFIRPVLPSNGSLSYVGATRNVRFGISIGGIHKIMTMGKDYIHYDWYLMRNLGSEDKLVAKGWLPFLGRIPEALLHQAELGGGTLGSFLAQRLFRHKTSKVSYQRRFSQILLMQMAAGSAWWYFQGLSWALVGAELLSGLMFVDTVRRIGRLNNNYISSSSSDWKYRLDRRGDKRSQQQPWQRPVSVTGGRPTRFGGGTEQGWRGTK